MLSRFLTQDEGHANIGNLHLLCHVCCVSGVGMVRQNIFQVLGIDHFTALSLVAWPLN